MSVTVEAPVAEAERGTGYAEGYAAGIEHCRRIFERGKEVGMLELAHALVLHTDMTTEVCLAVLGRASPAPVSGEEAVDVRH